jgi:hypothetical protein
MPGPSTVPKLSKECILPVIAMIIKNKVAKSSFSN